MKKQALAALLSLLLILSLAGCGSSMSAADNNANYMSSPAEAPQPEPESDYSESGIAASEAQKSSGGGESDVPTADKIIYSAYAEVETRDFDASVEGVYKLIERFGGFLESSDVTGANYYDTNYSRSASFVIRIPSAHFSELTSSLSELGNVPYCRTDAENITMQYNDTQSRLEAYEIEYDRLLSMLEKADTVEDMLAIESRLSDVRYNIQSLSNTISGWDSLLSYSTVKLSLSEVVEYTDEPVEEVGYWQSIGQAFTSTLRGVGRFFKSLLRILVALSPVLVILAVVAFAVILIVKKVRKHRRDRQPPADTDGKS